MALVTDGRMSGASGRILAAIRCTPEAAVGGPLGRLRDGDLITVDGELGTLDVVGVDLRERDSAPPPDAAGHRARDRRGGDRGLRWIASDVPDAVVGAGTVLSPADVAGARQAGATFLVSPGATPALLDALQASGAPFLAGVSTASDVITLLERGITTAKLFPAEAVGGTALLRALSGPFPQMRFCPTGGVDEARAPAYLALGNVACIGGSWIADAEAIRTRDWSGVERRARAVVDATAATVP